MMLSVNWLRHTVENGMTDGSFEKPFNEILRTALVVVNIDIDDHCDSNVYNSTKYPFKWHFKN